MKIARIEKYPAYIPIIAKWLYNEWIWKMPEGSMAFAEKVLMAKPDDTGMLSAFVAAIEQA